MKKQSEGRGDKDWQCSKAEIESDSWCSISWERSQRRYLEDQTGKSHG